MDANITVLGYYHLYQLFCRKTLISFIKVYLLPACNKLWFRWFSRFNHPAPDNEFPYGLSCCYNPDSVFVSGRIRASFFGLYTRT